MGGRYPLFEGQRWGQPHEVNQQVANREYLQFSLDSNARFGILAAKVAMRTSSLHYEAGIYKAL
jgi:hypothetical protein